MSPSWSRCGSRRSTTSQSYAKLTGLLEGTARRYSIARNAGPVHILRCKSGLYVFRHDRGQAQHCSWARAEAGGESELHEGLKCFIANAAERVKGWTAEVEVQLDVADPETGGRPVVDVVATNAETESNYGWEVQLSAQSDATVLNRQEVREQNPVPRSWEWKGEEPAWASQVPSLGLETEQGRAPHVVVGLVEWRDGDFAAAPAQPLSEVVRDQLARGGLIWAQGVGWYDPHEVDRPPRARRQSAISGAGHNPREDCDRPVVIVGPRPVVREPELLDPEWRPRANLPGLVPMSDDEYRRAMSQAAAAYRAAPHAGPPPGWDADEAAARIRLQMQGEWSDPQLEDDQ